jgi:ADP-ribose pyrophosphatase YjhB (NUDIX family)
MNRLKYKNPVPCAICLLPINKNNKIYLLGIKRGIVPFKGGLALPGGYVDELENINTALSRELYEETLVSTQAENWSIISSEITTSNHLLFFGLYKTALDFNSIDFTHFGIETESVELIDENSVVVFPLHQSIIQWFFDKEKNKTL